MKIFKLLIMAILLVATAYGTNSVFAPPAAEYPNLKNIVSVFHVNPKIVHPNEIDAAQIEVQNNGNFALYDVQVHFWNDTTLALHRPDKIDTLQPHETKIIRGALSTSNITSGTRDLFWQIIAKNETGTIMESILFQRPLTVEDISKSQEFNYCCRDLDSTSPLKQLKSGIDLDKIQCKENLVLIFKASDSSPACVRHETAVKLEQRGWGTGLTSSVLQTSGTQLPASFIDCHTPYPQVSDGIAVLYMPTNSIGKICVRYSNLNDIITPVGIRIFEANNLTQNASEITTWASGKTIQGNATIVYTIRTGDKAGFYGLSLFCGGMPLAVGYDANSTIVANDFPWVDKVFHCPVQTYEFHIDSMERIGVRYISTYSNFP